MSERSAISLPPSFDIYAAFVSPYRALRYAGHIVDAQSFPMDPPSAPRLVRGAYSSSLTYSMGDLQQVVRHGAERGVQVLLEIDVPGHAASWTQGYPEVMADCFVKYSYNINDFALNPTKEATYSLLEGVLRDVVDATAAGSSADGGRSQSMIHVGGDEVVYGCWNNDTSILQVGLVWEEEAQSVGLVGDPTSCMCACVFVCI